MKFTFWNDANGMVTVIKERDGGCDSFQASFSSMEAAQDFVIRILALDGSLPKEIKEEIL